MLHPVDRAQIAREASALGVRPGGVLVVHSSLRSIGHVRGGAPAVIDGLREAIGPEGTLVMPTFTFSIETWGLGEYDPRHTPSRVGAISEAFRLFPGTLRSAHPSHSVAALGPLAEALVGGPADYTPLGLGSPLDRAAALGAQVLLIGVGQNRNSTIHVAEAHAPAPYLHVTFTRERDHEIGLLRTPEGTLRQMPLYQMPGSSEGFGAAETLLEAAGLIGRGKIGRAPCQLSPARETVEVIASALRADPGLLLRSPEATELSRRRLAILHRTPGAAPAP
jgi:aminoglycoside N3'-acetyltransferase